MSIDSTKPIIVVGAGIGGLSAAVALRAKGLPVTVIEQHAAPGGKMRTLQVAGHNIDAGPTVFTMRWVFDSLFARAGLQLEDYLTLHDASLLARHSWLDKSQLDLYPNIEDSTAAIDEFASHKDADNYRRFAQETQNVFNTLNDSFMQAQRPNPIALSVSGGLKGMIDMANTKPFVSLWRYLSKTFDDPRLRQLFARYATYCGSSPFKAPATLMLIAHVERAGVSLVEGGMQSLANSLALTLEHLGTELRYGEQVAELDVQAGKVSGVVLQSGHYLPASAVVFNGDTQALATGLLGTPAKKACAPRQEASLSAVTRCQVAKTSGFDLAHHTVFFGDDYADEFSQVFDHQQLTQRPTVYVCAQDRTAQETSKKTTLTHERLFSLVNAPAATMTERLVQQAIERMQSTLSDQGLDIFEEQGNSVITSPNEFSQLFPATEGALYGRPTHGWMGSFKRPGAASRLKGLYLCGGSVHPGAGVPMASLSGQLAADKLCLDYHYHR